MDLGILTPQEETSIMITMTYEHSGGALPLGFPFNKQPTAIEFAVDSAPIGCTVVANQTSFSAPIAGFFQQGSVALTGNLTIKYTDQAIAFTPGTIQLSATAAQNGNLNPSTAFLNLSVQPGFLGSIETTLSESSIELEEDESHQCILSVTNTGNADIVASINSDIQTTQDITIALPSAQTISQDESYDFIISLNSTITSEETLTKNMTFTVSYYAEDQSSAIGNPVDLSYRVDLLGTSVNESQVDLLPYVVGIAVIFAVLYLLFTVIAWRRKQYYE